jgi:hypothetical protein
MRGPSSDVTMRRPFALTWEKKEQLGRGQYATVFRVVNRTTGVVAAVKEILKQPLTKEDLEALAVEVKAMELLRDNINFVKCGGGRARAAPRRRAPRAARRALRAASRTPRTPSPPSLPSFPPAPQDYGFFQRGRVLLHCARARDGRRAL